MARVPVTDRAGADIDGIYEWSIGQFGLEVAETYVRALNERFAMLNEYPFLGTPRDELHPGLRSHRHQRHSIFYITRDSGILVVRVMHTAQDVQSEDFN